MMFDFRAQFLKICIMELITVLGDLALSSEGFVCDPASIALSLFERSSSFTVVSPVQNKNVRTKNADNLIGESSFAQLAIEIVAPFSRDNLIAGFDFIVDHGDDKDESIEVSGDNNRGEDGR